MDDQGRSGRWNSGFETERIMRIVIGYDGSEPARDALHELHRAGLPGDASAAIVSVADVWPGAAGASFEPGSDITGWQSAPIVRRARALAEQSVAEARALAAEGGALVKAEFPGWTVSHDVYAGSPSEALVKAADATSDLIVVVSQGRSALGRLVLGSVSQNVLRHATCSVRISRRPPADAAPRSGAVRIIIGIDGSRHSALAVSAVARVWPAGTEVKVIAALDVKLLSVLAGATPSPWARPWMETAPRVDDARDWARDALDEVAAELRAAGLAAAGVVEDADPKQLLVQEAQRWSADCIFVGAQGHSAIERYLLGSVSATVAARATCSVEVIRQG
jgi:nucleotide-binding universal stress UspA family protein